MTPEPGLVVAAVPEREDPRDVVVARDGLILGELPAGSVVGTGSPRRAAQIAALGLGLLVVTCAATSTPGCGWSPTAQVDAVVLARAGLARLGRLDAVGGDARPAADAARPRARARSRSSAVPTAPTCAPPSRPSTTPTPGRPSTAERALLAALEAGCTAPDRRAGRGRRGRGRARAVAAGLRRRARRLVDSAPLRASVPPDAPDLLGQRLAALLLADGAAALVRGDPTDLLTSSPPSPAPLQTREPAS